MESCENIPKETFDFDIMREDLREWIFKEDDESRYRERIWDKINEFGVEKWFKAKGYPTNPESIWKNRYCGTLTTLGEEANGTKWRTLEEANGTKWRTLEEQGYLLWENYLPQESWNDKELSLSYRPGTKEYFNRIKEEEAHDKKYSKDKKAFKPKSQKGLYNLDDADEEDSCLAEEEDKELTKIKEESICPVIECVEVNGEIKEVSDNNPNETDVERVKISISLIGNVFTEQRLSESSAHEMPKGKLGGSWGCGGELKGTNEELMEHFLEYFKSWAEKPYSDSETPFTTTLKLENCEIDISKEARVFLEKKGFDFKKYDEEKAKITQRIATQEDISKGKTFELMEKSMEKLRSECWAIKGYFGCFMERKSSSQDYHIGQLKKLGIDYSDLNKLKELYDSKAKVYKIYYNKVYMMRWGKACDEENSNV